MMIEQTVVQNRIDKRRSESGRSMIEIAIVVALIAIVSAIAVPPLISARRMHRAAGMGREVLTQIRYARQLALSKRKAITLQYDDATKQITIIQHEKIYDPDGVPNSGDETRVGTRVLSDTGYPMTTGAIVLRTIPLAASGSPVGDITFGKPANASANALGDGTNMPSPVPNPLFVRITFQPDGSVIDSTGSVSNNVIFLYNSKDPNNTAFAVSVLGAAGRAKLWRYSSSATTYSE